ncbi:hypothetical protein OCU04_004177 [Sclerotinia nivalis]|nr:hypothetical protein OCU04_004177 [Sclerotinia nivalis]
MNNMGYVTVVLIQGNPGDFKLWPTAETGHLDKERQKEIWLDFGRSGAGWCPPLDVKIMVYELQSGDIMLMMPGAIHTPMTPTPCLLFGMTRP